MATVRTRTAPSPTGPPHVGTAYIALFNLAFARKHGGQFIMRTEDTDQSRSAPQYEERLIKALRWLELDWDEGPDIGGPHGPYRQSERLPIYRQYVQQLVEGSHAYPCFCSAERLDTLRAEQMRNKEKIGYDGHCRDLDPAQAQKRLDQPHVIRMKMPNEGTCTVKDTLRGDISFEYAQLDDQVLLKSDGFPTYHLAVVVDDHLMGITHVIRGEEWINSTPKHLLLFQMFGWQPPVYTHMPLLRNPDGSKLSKRKNPTSIDFYRDAGYLGKSLVNYLGLMAYSPGEEEKVDLATWIDGFEPDRISLGGPVFDLEKLKWLNGRYIREDLSPQDLLEQMRQWRFGDDSLSQILPLVQERMETLGDFIDRCAFFFLSSVEAKAEDLVPKNRQADEVAQMLQTAAWSLEVLNPWDKNQVETALRPIAEFWDWKIREITGPLFAALMGQRVGPPLFESIVLLGPDLTRSRIIAAIEVLGGLSKKKMAKLEKAWQRGSRD